MEIIEVTCAVILKDGKVLATQRSVGMAHPLEWEFPGGKVRQDESLEDCLTREIREELGVGIDILYPMEKVKHAYGGKAIRLHPFVCSLHPGTIRLAEHARYRWVPCEGLSATGWLEADLAVVEQLRRDGCQ